MPADVDGRVKLLDTRKTDSRSRRVIEVDTHSSGVGKTNRSFATRDSDEAGPDLAILGVNTFSKVRSRALRKKNRLAGK